MVLALAEGQPSSADLVATRRRRSSAERQLASYIRKEAEDQGTASVRMGRPVIDGDRVAAEFWVTRSNDDQDWTTAGSFIARLGADGRCTFFRESWFDVAGHIQPYAGWGE